AHFGDGGHCLCANGRFAKVGQVRIGADDGVPGRRTVAAIGQQLHRFGRGNDFGQEGLGQQHVFAQRVHRKTPHAQERDTGFGSRWEGGDFIGNTRGADAVQSPRASHEEGNLTGFELEVSGIPVGAAADVTSFNVVLDEVTSGNHTFAVDTDIAGVVGAVFVHAEHVTTKGGLQREGVVGGASQGQSVGRVATVNQGATNLDQFVPGSRSGFNHFWVVEESHVLDSVGNTNQLTIKGPCLESKRVEFSCFVAQINGGQQTTFNKTTQTVVGQHDNVRAF